jgi:twitching motility protein PilT
VEITELLRHTVEVGAEIRDIIGEGGFYGMQTFDQALVGLVEGGLVTEEDARFASTRPHDFVLALRGTLARS